jgi:hypothetical protein
MRPGFVLLKQDDVNFCPLPRDAFFEIFVVSIWRSEFTVAFFFSGS